MVGRTTVWLRYLPRRAFGRMVVLLGMDVVATGAAAYLAIAVRFDDPLPLEQLRQWLPILLVPLFVRPSVNYFSRLYRHSWRHAGISELVRLSGATVIGTLLVIAIYVAFVLAGLPAATGFPRSFWILEAVFALAAMGSLRLAPRLLNDLTIRADDGSKAILFGAGDAGALFARAAKHQPSAGIRPVAFLDDRREKWGKVHAGVSVRGGLEALARVAKATGAPTLLITMPTASGDRVREIADAAIAQGLVVRTIPSLQEMANGQVGPEMVRPLRLEDLLRRPPVPSDVLAELAADLADARVLVTGAGGSIGSELARQLASLAPRSLVLIDRAEGPLYELQREIEGRQSRGDLPQAEVRFLIGDVANRAAMTRVVEQARPSVIFHAAAYKHVPVMERHPASAVEVNVGGTLTMLEAASENDVERFVLISTDKAVEPTSVMGATKRMAELLVADFSRANGRPWVSVRFGNVLGSSGSVVPIFQKQLENGEALTVTHEDMTRFFMTVPEAVHLILQAATIAHSGDVFVLDMGEPVRIVDLARDFLRLRGIHDSRARIEFTGMRPGERLHEQLFDPHEDAVRTSHSKVFRVRSSDSRRVPVRRTAQDLVELARAGKETELRRRLMKAVAAKPVSVAGSVGRWSPREVRRPTGAEPFAGPH